MFIHPVRPGIFFLLFLVALVRPALAEDLEMADGTKMPGTPGRIIPVQVEITLLSGTSLVPLEKFSPAQQRKILGRLPDALLIDDLTRRLAAAGNSATRVQELENALAVAVRLAQDKEEYIGHLEDQLGIERTISTKPGDEMPGVILDKVKAQAAAAHPGKPDVQLSVIKDHIKYWKKLQFIDAPELRYQASKTHPYDFITQYFVVKEALDAQPTPSPASPR